MTGHEVKSRLESDVQVWVRDDMQDRPRLLPHQRRLLGRWSVWYVTGHSGVKVATNVLGRGASR
jgi:hypothetical protein